MSLKARPRKQSERAKMVLPLTECVRDYLADCTARGHSTRTVAHYRRAMELFAQFLPSDTQWDSARAVREAVAMLRAQPQYSAASVGMYTRAWRSYLRFCYLEEMVAEDLARYIKPPKAEPRRDVVLDADAVRRLLNVAEVGNNGTRDVAMLTVLYDTGLRAGELCALTVKNVDLGSRTLTVPSGKSGGRSVPIGRTTAKTLRKWLTVHRNATDPRAPFFPSALTGNALTPNALGQCLGRIGSRASLKIHPHQFRHSFAVMYLRNGGDSFSLQRILGHSTLVMTRWYSDLADTDVAQRHSIASPADRLGKGR